MSKSFLLFLWIGFPAAAQHYKLDSVVHTVKDTQFMVSQKYDTENNTREIIRYARAGTNGTVRKAERTQVTYDNKGNELCNVFSVWNPKSNTWIEEEKTEKKFNADNKIVRVVNHRKLNNNWRKEFESIRIFSRDSIIETDYETRNDNFQPVLKNISVLNASNRVKTHEIFHWDHNWQPLTRTTNRYQNDTLLMGFETLKWRENVWEKQEKVVYHLNKNGADNYTLYKARHDGWIPVSKFEELPEQNKKVSRTYQWSEPANQWIVSSQTETFFNKEGKKQDVIFFEPDTSTHQLKIQLEQLNLYDKEGRLTLFQEFDHSKEKITGIQNTITFDKEGNVIRENLYERDVENETWTEKTTTELGYDRNIEVNALPEIFSLKDYNYTGNKHVIKQVKIYTYEKGKKAVHEVFDYFYSIAK